MDYPVCAETLEPWECLVENLPKDLHVADEGLPTLISGMLRFVQAYSLNSFSIASLTSCFFSEISIQRQPSPNMSESTFLTFGISG